jgi:hypothetical protein
LGVLTTETPTDEELAEANIIYISHCVDLRPNDGLQYDLKPMLQDDGTWIEKWYQVEASAERLEFLRQHQTNVVILDRNAKLAASEWTQMSDVNLTNKTEWAVYRQALRDLPEQEGFPFVVVYPQKPE